MICLTAVMAATAQPGDSPYVESPQSASFQAGKFLQFYKYLTDTYIDKLDAGELVETAIVEMLATLDPHSYYTSPEEMVAVNESFDGKFSGIGVQIYMVQDTLRASGIISGGPAEKVGMLPGDRIVRVDTTSIVGMTQMESIKLMRGPKGTKVNIHVVRPGSGDLSFHITRDDISIETIDAAYMPSHGVGYIKVNRFAHTTMDEFRRAFEGFGKGVNSLIVDLRGNGGGLMNQAIDMSGFFLPKGSLILSTQGRSVPLQRYPSEDKGAFLKGRVIVLIDDFSASGSEIVAGALQDWDRAVIIGRRSYGKGLVQRQYPLVDGSTVSITVSRYLTPSGRAIQRPFTLGHEDEYRDSFAARFESGYVDTLAYADSLRFRTLKLGREVFGGSGIYPDYYVASDTTGYSDYMMELVRKGVVYEYSNEYIDKHRAELLERHPSFGGFFKEFTVSDAMYEELAEMGEGREVERDPEGLEEARGRISLSLRAYIARALYGETEATRVVNEDDPMMKKAMEVLQHWDTMSKGISGK